MERDLETHRQTDRDREFNAWAIYVQKLISLLKL